MKSIVMLVALHCTNIICNGQTISGNIKDEGGKIISSATVSLLRAKDSSAVKFSISDKEGKYVFSHVKEGSYLILVTSIGFERWLSTSFAYDGKYQVIPPITLIAAKKDLAAVTVQSSRPFLEMRLDKMIVNVDASPTNAGSNVLEVLAKSPSISVDMDENISLNGKQGVQILLDGKRTYLSSKDLATLLKSMPSSSVDQIEIMTTPSAKYDADGMAGVINIKTKKNKNAGWNGNFTSSFRTNIFQSDGTTFLMPTSEDNLTFNYKKNKVNLYGSTGFNSYKGRGISTYQKTYYAPDNTVNGSTYFVVKSIFSGNYAPINVGLDYTVNKKNVIGVVAGATIYSSGTQPRERSTAIWDANGQLMVNYISSEKHHNSFKKTSGNINWKHSIDTLGQEFSFDADYVRYRFPYEDDLITTYGNQSTYLNSSSHPATDITAFKADYLKPFKNGRIEAGLKTSFVSTKLNNEYFRLQNNEWKSDPSLDNRFSYHENISAIYINLNKQIKRWSLQGGLRLERMEAEGNQAISNTGFKKNNTGLFPSIASSYDINKNNTVKVSFSRRINRPQFYALMPYFTIVDSLDVWHGNPALKPEHSNRLELGYSLQSKYFITLSYTVTHDIIQYIAGQIGTQRATEFYPINIDKLKNLALTISSPVKPTRWWDVNVFTSLYSNKYYNLQNGSVSKFYVTFNQNINNTIQLGKTLKGELNFSYTTKSIDQITETEAILGDFSIGLKKQMLNEKGNLTLNISDPFDWYKYRYKAHFIRMYEVGTARYSSRSISFTFSYRFGRVNNQSRQRTTASQEEQNR